MAVRRRRPGRPEPKSALGRESWAILGADGKVIREVASGEMVALVLAQTHALDCLTEAGELTVELRSLLGPSDLLYHVVRDEHGAVHTRVI